MNSFTLSEHSNNAVKAIIFNADGKILLQKRDNHKNLPFANCWNFFGGIVEKEESLTAALKRELNEEISYIPKNIENAAFNWIWKSEWRQTVNHFYPLLWDGQISDFDLKEGQEMRLFSLDEILKLELVPAIYCNFANIYKIISKDKNAINGNLINFITDKFVKNNNLIKKNERVYFAASENIKLSRQQIFLFREISILNNLEVSRICLHRDQNSLIQEMIMFHCKSTTVGPLKQLNQSISYHIVDGVIQISVYENEKIRDTYTLSSISYSNKQLGSIRINPDEYRTVSSITENAIFIETTNGPFKDDDTIWLEERHKIEK